MPQMYQRGSSVGTVIGPPSAPVAADDTIKAAAFSPSTDAGQALIRAGVGLVILYLTVARGEGNLFARLGRVVEFLVVIAAAMWSVNYLGRTYAALNPDGPLAAGVRFDT